MPVEFAKAFKELTENAPFPWQEAMYGHMAAGEWDALATCSLPTGLGKTNAIAVWLIAQANHPDRVPRRLVYVVNRRTVVDQTTDVAKKLWDNAEKAGVRQPAISTLRGQFADNREWSADPSKPAIICGTVDMIGSRLLFSGYGIGFKSRPLHAGFLGQNVLLIHDEAHLEPAFQKLIEAIRDEQLRCKEFTKFHVIELSATSRGAGTAFTLSDKDLKVEEVRRRVNAKKTLHLIENDDDRRLADKVADHVVKKFKDSGKAVLVFVRRVDDVDKVIKRLPQGSCEQLTGTLRGLERDGLVRRSVFQRFLPPSDRDKDVKLAEGTVYLVCTSAGEVGVNISADHLVCDLTTFDSMAQRFGRVNRFGLLDETEIHVFYPAKFDDKDDTDLRLKETLKLLQSASSSASPAVLGALHRKAMDVGGDTGPMSTDRTEALRDYILSTYARQPVVLSTSEILFDAWALSSARGDLPGRPPPGQYLHGVEDEQSFETQFAWREEVALLTGRVPDRTLGELLSEFPLRPHELLRVTTYGKGRAYDQLEEIAGRAPDLPAWVVEPDGEVKSYESLRDVVRKEGKDSAIPLAARTVVLPTRAGGLSEKGTLAGQEAYSATLPYDVAGTPPPKVAPLFRVLMSPVDAGVVITQVGTIDDWPSDLRVEGETVGIALRALNDGFAARAISPVRPALRLDLAPKEKGSEEDTPEHYLILRPIGQRKQAAPAEWPALDGHLAGVRRCADAICMGLHLDPRLARAISLAAVWHDIGKGRAVWQRGAGNLPGRTPVAKTLHGRPPEDLNHYRHELGSLVDLAVHPVWTTEFRTLDPELQDLVLHLIATHHGRGRPHFPSGEDKDPDRPAAVVAAVVEQTSGRFARLQRAYGRWGLAFLESLLRAADAMESQRIEACAIPNPVVGEWPDAAPKLSPLPAVAVSPATIRVTVDPKNPGQFFACCGILELADRLWPGVEGWFAEGQFCVTGSGTLREVLQALIARQPDVLTTLPNGLTVAPLIAPLRLTLGDGPRQQLVLDAWTAIRVEKREVVVGPNRPWNFWSGRQTTAIIWGKLRTALADQLKRLAGDDLPNLFSERLLLTGRFGFDPGPAWNALDVGFSLNDQGIEVQSSAALELLAQVGLQRNRPVMASDRSTFLYSTWGRPLSPVVTPAAVAGQLHAAPAGRYRGYVVDRGQYAALGYSTLLLGAADE